MVFRRIYKQLWNKKWLKGQYIDKHLTLSEIAMVVGCCPATVHHVLKRYGLDEKKRLALLNDKNWLYKQYCDKKTSLRKIASNVACSQAAVARALKRHNIPTRSVQTGNRLKNPNVSYSLLDDKEWLHQKYCKEKLGTTLIGKIIGCFPSTVYKALKKCEIEIRSPKEAAKVMKKPHIYPNNIEKIFLEICNKHHLPYKYTGDNSFRIGKLNPDFVNCNGKKIVIEIFGDYWHSPLLNKNIKSCMCYDVKKQILKEYGWELVVLWESDLKRDDVEQFVLSHLEKEKAI